MLYAMVKGPLTIAIEASDNLEETSLVIIEAIQEYGVTSNQLLSTSNSHFDEIEILSDNNSDVSNDRRRSKDAKRDRKRSSVGVYGVLNEIPF